ncbi:hypothetical protein QUF80_18615 [Desulfococcaceae bacterium HSG8]|nr:hypothetical protein [Desulfococcaceae bacterium HSG8]
MMEQGQVIKQMVDFQKSVFDGSFNTMTMVQERTGKMMDMFMDQAAWMPEEWKSTVNVWSKAYQEGWETLRKTVDDNFDKVESNLTGI